MSDASNGRHEARTTVRVLIADDHALVRAGLRMMLEDEPDLEVVGEASDGAEALTMTLALQPTIVLADVSMPPPDGIELTRLLRRDVPDVKTIVVTMHEDAEMLRDALAGGAAGYVLKRSGPVELLAAIRAAAAGERYVDRQWRERGADLR